MAALKFQFGMDRPFLECLCRLALQNVLGVDLAIVFWEILLYVFFFRCLGSPEKHKAKKMLTGLGVLASLSRRQSNCRIFLAHVMENSFYPKTVRKSVHL